MSAVYDPASDGMWVYGGFGASGVNDVNVYWPTGGPTPTWLQNFTLARTGDGVEVRWRVTETTVSDAFQLVARRDADSWIVPVSSQQSRNFVATDRSPLLDAGGTVHYILSYRDPERDWLVLASQALELQVASRRTQLLALQPNPATDRVVVPFVIGRRQHVVATVHDVRGREIARLFEGAVAPGSGSSCGRGATTAVSGCRLVSTSCAS
jgi:hypothetical protein